MSPFYKNRKQRFHPCYEVSSDDKKWQNMTLTHQPVKGESYIPLDKNPNPNDSQKSYLRKYVASDPIKTRGQHLKNYHLSTSDQVKVNQYLEERKRNQSIDRQNRKNAAKRSKQK